MVDAKLLSADIISRSPQDESFGVSGTPWMAEIDLSLGVKKKGALQSILGKISSGFVYAPIGDQVVCIVCSQAYADQNPTEINQDFGGKVMMADVFDFQKVTDDIRNKVEQRQFESPEALLDELGRYYIVEDSTTG